KKVDLEDNANLFTVSAILIPGIGGMAMSIGKVTITSIACALILGIITNIVLNKGRKNSDEK
ncbi:MAG: uracil-xanthine permease, partial [Clostridia bacterium]|nr:uracil-xanthine permease [Clostridia bacterium]